MPDPRWVSDCCGAECRPNVENHPGEGVTRWIECSSCGKPCDPMLSDLRQRIKDEGRDECIRSVMDNPTASPDSLAAKLWRGGIREGMERAETIAKKFAAIWKRNADRPSSEHSGPSLAAAVAGEASANDIVTAIRAAMEEVGK